MGTRQSRRASNNRAEALTLFQGLRIIDENDIKRLTVIGDSALIIKLMLRASTPSDGKLIRIVKRIRMEVTKFERVELFHILRTLNQKTDLLANKVILLDCDNLRTKSGDAIYPIP